jgi:hypothetical protein
MRGWIAFRIFISKWGGSPQFDAAIWIPVLDTLQAKMPCNLQGIFDEMIQP